MIHFIVKKSILLSLMLVETFANNSIYFPNEDNFVITNFGVLKVFYMIWILL